MKQVKPGQLWLDMLEFNSVDRIDTHGCMYMVLGESSHEGFWRVVYSDGERAEFREEQMVHDKLVSDCEEQ